MEEINNRIKQEICYKIIQDLSDECLINQYKECISVKNEIKKIIFNGGFTNGITCINKHKFD